MTADEQLKSWLEGNPKCPSDRGECCPDFSCCNPKARVSKRLRKEFYKAHLNNDKEKIHQMLMGFLMNSLSATKGKKINVYVTG